MVNFTLDAMVSSMPVIRPLWMLDPDDHANLVIDDEFLIGNKVILTVVGQVQAKKLVKSNK